MLPPKHRLTKTADVSLTTAKGRSFFNQFFVIKYLTKKAPEVSKWTVVVSAKTAKQAVVRNRLKRISREVIHQKLVKIKPGFYVMIIKKLATTIPAAKLREEINNSLKQSKILNQ